MEGISGAADFGSLRGDPGEAALGPGGVGLREHSDAPVWASAQVCESDLCRHQSDRRPRESRSCGGHVGPRLRVYSRGPVYEAGSLRCFVWLRLDEAGCRVLLPAPLRFRDKRCPSESGRGKAPSSTLKWAARGAGRRESVGLWSEKSRLATGRIFPMRPQGQQRRTMSGGHPESAVDVAEGAPTLSGVSPSPAQAGCVTSGVRAGDWAIYGLCSRAVLIAEVDERRPVQAPCARGSGHSALCSSGERMLEAGSRWKHREPVAGCRRSRCPDHCEAQAKQREGFGASWDGGDNTRRGKASWFWRNHRFWRTGGRDGAWRRVLSAA